MTIEDQDTDADGDSLENAADLFPFRIEEKELIDKLVMRIRAKLPKLEPVDLQKIAIVLFALERLPYVTPSISCDLAVTQRVNRDMTYASVEVTGDAFRLSTGGSVHSPDAGSDSYSETNFEVEIGGYREGNLATFDDWLESFGSIAGPYTLSTESDVELDSIDETPTDGWDRLAVYWDSQGENLD